MGMRTLSFTFPVAETAAPSFAGTAGAADAGGVSADAGSAGADCAGALSEFRFKRNRGS
jgi:hypothetical protein